MGLALSNHLHRKKFAIFVTLNDESVVAMLMFCHTGPCETFKRQVRNFRFFYLGVQVVWSLSGYRC